MSLKKLVMGGVAAAVLSTSAVATAGEFEANVALSTDYIFRGVSQTNNDPAISGGFDYSFDNGFYAGVWASNVNFGSNSFINEDGELDGTSSTSTEIDVYGGYAVEISEGVELDFGYIYFVYPGDSGALNYSEYTASISFDDLAFGLVYSDDYFGTDQEVVIFNVDYSVGLAENLTLNLHSGYLTASDTDEGGVDIGLGGLGAEIGDDYLEYSIGLSTTQAGLDFSLTYHDTDISDNDAESIDAEDRIVLSVGKSF